jgi:hypothetical protein
MLKAAAARSSAGGLFSALAAPRARQPRHRSRCSTAGGAGDAAPRQHRRDERLPARASWRFERPPPRSMGHADTLVEPYERPCHFAYPGKEANSRLKPSLFMKRQKPNETIGLPASEPQATCEGGAPCCDREPAPRRTEEPRCLRPGGACCPRAAHCRWNKWSARCGTSQEIKDGSESAGGVVFCLGGYAIRSLSQRA